MFYKNHYRFCWLIFYFSYFYCFMLLLLWWWKLRLFRFSLLICTLEARKEKTRSKEKKKKKNDNKRNDGSCKPYYCRYISYNYYWKYFQCIRIGYSWKEWSIFVFLSFVAVYSFWLQFKKPNRQKKKIQFFWKVNEKRNECFLFYQFLLIKNFFVLTLNFDFFYLFHFGFYS